MFTGELSRRSISASLLLGCFAFMLTGLSIPDTTLAADKVIDGGTYTRMSDGDTGDQARYTSDGNLTINGATFNTQNPVTSYTEGIETSRDNSLKLTDPSSGGFISDETAQQKGPVYVKALAAARKSDAASRIVGLDIAAGKDLTINSGTFSLAGANEKHFSGESITINGGTFNMSEAYTTFTSAGGITINNQIYSDADIQILDATDADVALDTYFSATMSKPVILFLTGTAHNFTTTGVKSISNDVIIIGRYDDEQVTLRPINCWKSCKGKLLFKNIKIDLSDLNGGSNAGYFINNAGVISKGDFTDICIDNCLIANVLKPIYYDAAQKTYFGIDNISVQDTRIEVNAIKIALINIYKGFNLGDYKTFNFKNNIVYSQTPQEGVQILNWATGNIPLSDGVLSAEIINNTFVNMIGSNIFFRYQKGTSLTISKNIFDVSPEAEFGSYYYSFLESCTPQIDVTDNIVYGLTKNWNYYHTSSLVKEPTSGNNITKHATAPITQYDYVNGIFTLASDVAGYGATIE